MYSASPLCQLKRFISSFHKIPMMIQGFIPCDKTQGLGVLGMQIYNITIHNYRLNSSDQQKRNINYLDFK